jgi:protocatechuate 3,4-dioxygenase beta subunit
MGWSRRELLTAVLGAFPGLATVQLLASETAQNGLDAFGMSGPPCTPDAKPTPAVVAEGFKPGSPERAVLRVEGTVGAPVVLTGTIAGVRCGRISGATVDLWQADGHGVLDVTGFKLRGHQVTNKDGGYRFETVIPGATQGQAPHFNLRVQPPGKPAFTTEIFLPSATANGADKHFQQALAARETKTGGEETLTFDVLLDL